MQRTKTAYCAPMGSLPHRRILSLLTNTQRNASLNCISSFKRSAPNIIEAAYCWYTDLILWGLISCKFKSQYKLSFAGMTMTTDKLRSMVKKWQTLIEANVDVKTTDGYLMRVFCIGFTKRRPNQVKKTCYAQSQQIKRIRKRMVDIITREIGGVDMKEVRLSGG